MKFLNSIQRTVFSITLAIVLSVFGAWFIFGNSTPPTQTASAGSTDNLSGYAWSSVAGWVSFNCMNTNNCDSFSTSNYGVRIVNDSSRFTAGAKSDLAGTAWIGNYDDKNNNGIYELADEFYIDANTNGVHDSSESYIDTNGNGRYDTKEAITFGWISFDRSKTGNPPFAPFNGGSGPIAQIDWDSGQISGWARVLAGCQGVPEAPVGSCSLSSAGAASGGWDGWIKLRSTGGEPNYGVQLAGNNLSGYAWGANFIDKDWDGAGGVHPNGIQDVAGCATIDPNDLCEETLGIGWVSFNCTNDSTCGTSNYGVKFTPTGQPPTPMCGITANTPTNSANAAPATSLCDSGSVSTPPSSSGLPKTWTWKCDVDAVSCSTKFTQCSDGIDNDGDGQVDLSDSGCSGSSDNTERNFRFREF